MANRLPVRPRRICAVIRGVYSRKGYMMLYKLLVINCVFIVSAFSGCGEIQPVTPEQQGCLCPPEYIHWDDSCNCDHPSPPPYETEI